MFKLAFLLCVSLLSLTTPSVKEFRGSKYGVSARCELDMQTRKAYVQLSGIPLGGSIQGSGSLADSKSVAGPVVLDPELERRLARRMVTVLNAAFDQDRSVLTVHVRVPVVGKISLDLIEVAKHEY